MSKINQKFFTLNNGNKIPAVGVIGTGSTWFKTAENDNTFSNDLVDQISQALKLPGIVHIDAAEIYRTYPEVGKAIKESSKPRDEIWITDKYSTAFKISDTPVDGLNVALKKLNVEYVDLLLLHSPWIDQAAYGFGVVKAWKYLEQLYQEGKAKNIGVSNFGVEDLKLLLSSPEVEIKPQVNQIEYNPFLQEQTPGIYQYCQEQNILLEAYHPLGPLVLKAKAKPDDEFVARNKDFYRLISELAEKYQKTESQILLEWTYEMNVLPVTTSSKFQRIKDAQYLFDPEFALSKEEVAKIRDLGSQNEPHRTYWKKEYD
ncbi:hypothetical protein ACO0QE_004331 [Hanseniaspora vineae]